MSSASAGEDAPVSPQVLEQAIDWQLRLGSGEAAPAEWRRLRQWLAADASHARAWAQLAALDAALLPAAEGSVRRLLVAPRRQRRRRAATALGVVFCAGLLALLPRQHPALFADHRTVAGERRSLTLPDRSALVLNSGTAIDVAFDARQRLIRLIAGEIHVETGHAAGESRAFVVETGEGSFRALGTRFSVRRLASGGTRVTVFESAVLARPATCSAAPATPCADERRLAAGRSLLMMDRPGEITAAAVAADAWTGGMFVAENLPLAVVVAELGRHRRGVLRVDPAVAALRVTGTFALDDTDLALDTLVAALPVRRQQLTRYWVTLAPRE